MAVKLSINRTTSAPVYVQLKEQIRLQVHRGELKPGDLMPTVRSLAVDLGINANTVSRVYRDLQTEGLLRLERGVGTFVEKSEHQPTLSAEDYGRIEKRARELVALSSAAGFTRRELSELITGLWKEIQNEG